MTTKSRTLDDFRGPSPCALHWEDLAGDDKIRYCSICSENVVNLSALTKAEAIRALENPKTGCVHVFREQDETPIFLKHPSANWRTLRFVSWVWTSLMLTFGIGCSNTTQTPSNLPTINKLEKESSQNSITQEPVRRETPSSVEKKSTNKGKALGEKNSIRRGWMGK